MPAQINLMSHPDVGWYWFLSYLAVYFSPFDLVYRMIQIPRSPTRIIFRSLECIDVLTTVRPPLFSSRRVAASLLDQISPQSVLLTWSGGLVSAPTVSTKRWLPTRQARWLR